MLTQDQIQKLDDEQRGAYAAFEAMFESPGWILLQDDIKDGVALAQQRVDYAGSWEEYQRARGTKDALLMLQAYQDTIMAQFERLTMPSAEEPADEVEYE